MDQQRILLDSSPWFVFLCAALAAGAAWLLYNAKHPWPKTWNQVLFVIRFVLTFFLLFLLLGPVVKQISNYLEKPLFVILYDNSASVAEATDSAQVLTLNERLGNTKNLLTEKGYEVKTISLDGADIESPVYTAEASDLNQALREVAQKYEGRNIGGVIFPTDGIYTNGLSPVYSNFNFPVYAVGLGDTTERTDVGIRNIAYNRIAYQGNKFPVRVEVQLRNVRNEPVQARLLHKGKIVSEQSKRSTQDQLLTFDFQPTADEQGIQKFDIEIAVKPGESNVRNNKASVFVEVVEGRKKILVVASSPHPDIKPIREVIQQNANYEFLLHIPGVDEAALRNTKTDEIDLVVFHQSPDTRGRTFQVFQQFIKSKASILFILGAQTDLRTLAQNNLPVRFESTPRDFDNVTPVVNPAFSNFNLSPEATSIFQDYPPVSVHFARMRFAPSASPLLLQKVGSISTEKPLLLIDNQSERKVGVMLGEGLWRWRLNEYDRTEKTVAFDELFSKLFQFLSTSDDKRKFKSYPIQQDFSDTEPVVFESQVYNDIFEPVYGNKIDISVIDEAGQRRNFNYITSPGNTRYQIGGLKEGVYKYRSSTVIGNNNEEVRGEFVVVARQAELQNLTADFDLLRRLSSKTGGRFYPASQAGQLEQHLLNAEVKNIIHSEESFDNLMNLKWIFWLLLIFISVEWFFRKYYGSY